MAKRRRYVISRLNGKFVVTDSASSELKVLNDQAQPANNQRSAEMKFFGMSLKEAETLSHQLNELYHF